jgi:hypothetical protein
LIRVNGDPDPYVPPPPDADWKRQVYEKVFNNPAGPGYDFRSYIRKASYGKADLVGDVYGPFNVRLQSNRAWMLADAAVQAYNQGLIRGVKYACGIFTAPGAWAYWNSPTAGTDLIGTCYVGMPDLMGSVGAVAMENFHIVTEMDDLYRKDGRPDDGPHNYDVMHCSCGPHPSSFTKIRFGWFDSVDSITIPPNIKDETVSLHALASPLVPNRIHTAKVETADPPKYFLIEARLREDDIYEKNTPGISVGIPNEGVVVYWVNESSWPPVHMLRPSPLTPAPILSNPQDKFTDPNTRVEITLVSKLQSGFNVNIKRGQIVMFASAPATGVFPDGGLQVFARGVDNRIYHVWADQQGNWLSQDWYYVGGPADVKFTGNNIAVGMFPDNNGFQVFARGVDNRIYHVWHDRWNWLSNDWYYVGGPSNRPITSDPTIGVFPDNGGFEVFARGLDNRIYHVWHDRWNWLSNDWTYLGGASDRKFVANVAIGIFPDRAFQVFARAADNRIYHVWSDGWNWLSNDWYYVGGPADVKFTGNNIAVGMFPDNNGFQVFARAEDNRIYHVWHDRWNWLSNDWYYVGGPAATSPTFTGDPVIAMFPDNGGFEVFARGVDNRIYHVWHDRWNWRAIDWAYLGGSSDRKFVSDPAVAMFPNGSFQVFARSEDNRIYRLRASRWNWLSKDWEIVY